MRIMMQREETPEPCENITFGEVEDYNVNIRPIMVGIEAQGLRVPPKPELNAYPNPTTGMVTLNINPGNEPVLNMDLVNSTGQVLKQKVFNNQGVVFTGSLDLSDLPNGMYYLVLKTKQGMIGQARIIKK